MIENLPNALTTRSGSGCVIVHVRVAGAPVLPAWSVAFTENECWPGESEEYEAGL